MNLSYTEITKIYRINPEKVIEQCVNACRSLQEATNDFNCHYILYINTYVNYL